MTEDKIKRKFHEFVIAMQEEAVIYELIRKVFEEIEDKDEAEKIVRERFAKVFEEAMEKSKKAWLAWKQTV